MIRQGCHSGCVQKEKPGRECKQSALVGMALRAMLIRPTCQLTRRDESGTRSICATLRHNLASSAAGHPVRPTIYVSPNHAPWGAKSAMSGLYLSVQLITGPFTALERRSGGGRKRGLTRSHMQSGFGGIQSTRVLTVRNCSWWPRPSPERCEKTQSSSPVFRDHEPRRHRSR